MIGPFIFLDIDGVLNHHTPHKNGYSALCPDCVDILNGIIEDTNAKIVVASAWRYFVLRGEMNLAGFQGLLCTHGLKWGTVVDVLGPDINLAGSANRAEAINEWFRTKFGKGHSVKAVVIDDMDLGYTGTICDPYVPWFKTNSGDGLCGLDADKLNGIEAHLGK